MQIQIRWLLQKPNGLDLHCLQRQIISEFSRPRVNDDDDGSNITLCQFSTSFYKEDNLGFFMALTLTTGPSISTNNI